MNNRYAMAKSMAAERGATLIVALVMLLLMTVIGVAGIQGVILQDRMAGNLQDYKLAFQAAEAALSEGEKEGQNFNSSLAGHYATPLTESPDPTLWRDQVDWGSGDSQQYSGNVAGVAAPPRYIIEELTFGSDGRVEKIRVTARGTGGRSSTNVILQSVFVL